MKKFYGAFMRAGALAVIILLMSFPLRAQDLKELESRVTVHTLKNGMTVLLMERHASPTISFHIYYDVGSVDEQIGKTGLAHMFEHMAFKGTPTLGTKDYAKEKPVLARIDVLEAELTAARDRGETAAKIKAIEDELDKVQKEEDALVVSNEVGQLYEKNGAVGLNAQTGRDATEYYVSLPANKAEFWAALESDRMAHPVFRQFYKERDVVMEERRRSIDTNPVGKLFEELIVTAFEAHPYGLHSGIGWPSDLEHLTRQDAEAFFKKYYTPANATIAIVGDFKTADMIRLVDNYFSSIPSAPKPPRIYTVEPRQQGERRVELEFDTNPYLMIGWHRPDARSPDDVVLDVIQDLLSSGRTSRLYRSLVVEKKMAAGVQALSTAPLTYGKYPTLFMIFGVPLAGHTTGELEKGIYEELDKLKETPVSPHELQKVVNQIDAELIRNLGSNAGMASLLAQTEVIEGNWKDLITYQEALHKVTPADVERVAQEIFKKANRTVAYHVPVEAEKTSAAPAVVGPASAESIAQAREIVTAATQAAGGLKLLQSVKNIEEKAMVKVQSPMGEQEVTATSHVLFPDKVKLEITLPQGTLVQAFNGTAGWMQFGPNTQDMPAAVADGLKESVTRHPVAFLVRLNDPAAKIQAMDETPVDAKPANVVVYTDAGGKPIKAYFDKATHLLVKMDYTSKNQFGAETTVEETFGDYRAVNGIQMAFASTQSQSGKKISDTKTTEIQINAVVDPKIFDKP